MKEEKGEKMKEGRKEGRKSRGEKKEARLDS